MAIRKYILNPRDRQIARGRRIGGRRARRLRSGMKNSPIVPPNEVSPAWDTPDEKSSPKRESTEPQF